MKYYLQLFFILFTVNCFGQKITGRVVDPLSKALTPVNVSLKSDSTLSQFTATDDNGNFSFEHLKIGSHYRISFTLIGYRRLDTTVYLQSQLNLSIILQSQDYQLGEVKVKSQRKTIERKIDRLVFNVENNINAVGINGLDLLSKTPLVRADDDGGIKIVGKEGVEVMIDNRPTHLNGQALAAFLKSLTAENISKIEVITAPPAEYDAQGNSGLINIVTKKVRKLGYSVTVNNNLTKNHYITSLQGINLNYNVNKFLAFGTLTTGHGANGPMNMQSRFYDKQSWTTNNENKERSNFLVGSLGFDYLASKNTTIGVSYNGSNSHPNLTGKSITRVVNNSTNEVDSLLYADYFNRKTFHTKSLNLHLAQNLDSLGKQLVFDGDYFRNETVIGNNSLNFNTLNDGTATPNPISNINSSNNLGSKGFTFNTVITIPNKKYKITFGNKLSFISSNNDVYFYRMIDAASVLDTANSNVFSYDENIQAVFGNFNAQFGKIGIQGGLRGEATQYKGLSPTTNQVNKNSYFSLFPTFYITYELNKKNTLSFNYSRRISRPYFSSLNPFRIYIDQYNYSTGNPFLKPSYTNNFEISNTFNHLLTTVLSYGVSTDLPTSIRLVSNNSNIQENIIGNYLTSKNFLLDNSVDLQPLTWLETSNELSLYYNLTTSSSALTQPKVKGTGGDFRSSNTVTFNKAGTIRAGVDFTYQFPFTSGISKFRKYYYFDVNSSFFALKKTLQITAAIRDIFKTKYVSTYSLINDIELTSRSNNDSRRFLLSIKYSFGNFKLRKGQSHNASGTEQTRSGN